MPVSTSQSSYCVTTLRLRAVLPLYYTCYGCCRCNWRMNRVLFFISEQSGRRRAANRLQQTNLFRSPVIKALAAELNCRKFATYSFLVVSRPCFPMAGKAMVFQGQARAVMSSYNFHLYCNFRNYFLLYFKS
jgi:hypothetical protein